MGLEVRRLTEHWLLSPDDRIESSEHERLGATEYAAADAQRHQRDGGGAGGITDVRGREGDEGSICRPEQMVSASVVRAESVCCVRPSLGGGWVGVGVPGGVSILKVHGVVTHRERLSQPRVGLAQAGKCGGGEEGGDEARVARLPACGEERGRAPWCHAMRGEG